jgi:hypothetical protein
MFFLASTLSGLPEEIVSVNLLSVPRLLQWPVAQRAVSLCPLVEAISLMLGSTKGESGV